MPISLFVVLMLLVIGMSIIWIPKKWIIYIGISIVGCAFGLLRFSVAINTTGQYQLDLFAANAENILVHGTIIDEPIKKKSYNQFTLKADNLITHGKEVLDIDTSILIKTDTYTDYEYGQEVIVQGVVQKPEAFLTENDRIFDYESYLAKDEIFYTMSFAEASIFEPGSPSLQRSLYRLKNNFLNSIYRFIPEPESGLLSGILFGQKSALGEDLEDKFRIVGLMHIVVLSGYNVSLVIQVFMKILHFLPRSVRAIGAVLSICGFALLVGAGPTVIRASIMAVFIVLADIVYARYNITRALFIAGIIMIIWNPMILYFDISFQLSFLATYGLIQCAPYLEKKFSFLPKFLSIRSSATATIAAQIMVLPLLIYSIGEFSLISPIVNVLVLFAVPVAMLMGFITAIVGIGLPIVAPIFAIITTLLLKYQLWIVDVFARIPFSYIKIPAFHWVFMIIMYLGIFWWIHQISKNNHSASAQEI